MQSKVDYYSGLLPMGPVISHSALSVTFTDTAGNPRADLSKCQGNNSNR